MKPLWNAIENNSSNDPQNLWEVIKPLRDLVFTEVNKISALNDKEIKAYIKDYDYGGSWDSTVVNFYNYNDKWLLADSSISFETIMGDGPSESSFYETPEWHIDVDAKSCLIWYHANGTFQSHSIDPNVINLTFSQLSWCNIDKLL
tara:strand:- start:93 stop:530 length:438 start_codon:yes stop_codon:yes gene_type:complete